MNSAGIMMFSDVQFDLNLSHIKDPVYIFIAGVCEQIDANPKVVEDACPLSGLAKMFDKNTHVTAVGMNAR